MNLKEIIEKSCPRTAFIRVCVCQPECDKFFVEPIPQVDGRFSYSDAARLAFGYNIVPLWPKVIEALESAVGGYEPTSAEDDVELARLHSVLEEAKKVQP